MEKEQSIPETEIQTSFELYQEVVVGRMQPQNIGLSYEEFENAYSSDTTAMMTLDGKKVPLFVRTDELYWYNTPFLLDEYDGRVTYFYSQVPASNEVNKHAKELLQRNGVIISSVLDNDSSSASLFDNLKRDIGSDLVSLGDVKGAFLNQYIGKVHINPDGMNEKVVNVRSYYDTYISAIENGDIVKNEDDGTFIVETVESQTEIDRLWLIYSRPFEDISAQSPISAGYDEDGFRKAMQDPSVIKAINIKDGLITTLAIFETTLDDATWLNKTYFEENFGDELETGNLLLFTGIVSDENMRGNSYSADVIQLLLKIAKLRGQDQIITFECNEVSAEYLPLIVDSVINESGIARVTGLEKAVSKVVFRSLHLSDIGLLTSE